MGNSVFFKTRKGLGDKRAEWINELQVDLVDAVDHLRKMSMNFSAATLQMLAKHIIIYSTKEEDDVQMRYENHEKLLVNVVTQSWIQRFMMNYNIVFQRQTGKVRLLSKV